MEFLNAMIKETLRFSSPVAGVFPRIALEDHELDGLKVKKGTLIGLSLLGVGYDPDNYEDPFNFNPNRWVGTNPIKDPFQFIPFSSGNRNCIGQHLALIETRLILAELLSRYDFELIEGYKLRMTNRFMYEPYEPLALKMKKISS
mmetsp:Transcript_146809/g.208076  ORF Transcript_146809/g.208076 Transcript_146809/m.208076 type:complete len:145 (+) Transcript_146809:1146-1580(+)